MNVQIYFRGDSCNLQDISQDKKREIFTIGLKRIVNDVNDLKFLILENNFFGIKEIRGDSILVDDGSQKNVNFMLHVDENFHPSNGNDVFCLFSTVNRVFFNDEIVPVHSIMPVPKIPCERANGTSILNNEIKEKIHDLIELFGRGAERLGDIISSRELSSVEFLERITGEHHE